LEPVIHSIVQSPINGRAIEGETDERGSDELTATTTTTTTASYYNPNRSLRSPMLKLPFQYIRIYSEIIQTNPFTPSASLNRDLP
jgi:hypothetical protein